MLYEIKIAHTLSGKKTEGCSEEHPFSFRATGMLLRDILGVLDGMAPFGTAEPWDNTGLMVGDPLMEVSSILVALDPVTETIEAAVSCGADLIVTHHPLIFSPLKRIDLQENVCRRIGRLIRSSIALVSMHTNLDAARGGVADELAEAGAL